MRTLFQQVSIAVMALTLSNSLHALTSVTITAPSSAEVSSTYFVSVSGYDDLDSITDLTVTRNGLYWKSASYDPWDSPRTDISVSGNVTAPSSPGSDSYYATLDTDYTSVYDSDSVSIVDTTAPSVPTGLGDNSKTMTSFNLTWSASTDNVGVTAYEIKRDTTSLGTVAGTSKSVTNLTYNTTYSMTVRARDAAGNWSGWSSARNVTTLNDTSAPSTPTNLAGSSITGTSFTLTWSASSDNIGVTAYEVKRDTTSLGTVGGTSKSVTNLINGTTYSMTVRARDAAGNWSSWSSAKNVTTLDTAAPSVPTGLAGSSISDTSFTLTWSASTDNVGVTAYEVKRDTTSLGTVGGTSKSVTNLLASTTYAMTVRARDAAGNWSGWSTAKNVMTTDTAAPSVPTGLSVSDITSTSFTLNWAASSDNVAVTGYEVRKDGVYFGSTASLSLSINTGVDLTGSNSYTMTVRARDAIPNWSNWSTGLTVSADSDGDGIEDWFEQLIIDDNPGDGLVDFTDVTTTSDYDGDGITDLQEFRLGLDPTTSNSSNDDGTINLQRSPL